MTSQRTWRGRVFVGVSLDGFIARPDGDIGWLTDPPPGRSHTAIVSTPRAEIWETFFPSVDCIVMGRGTYETVCSFPIWPYGGKAVIVLSAITEASEHGVLAAASIREAVAMLNQLGARQVYVDGGQTIQAFLRAGLIDEITVSVAPVVLGKGIRLFGGIAEDILLEVRGSHVDSAGMICTTYAVHV